MFEANESKLVVDVAESISSGAAVDWDHVERQPADEHDTGVLRELHVVDRIAAFYRSPETDSSRPIDPSHRHIEHGDRTALRGHDLGRWGHLILLEQIGEGTFATVYRARDDKLQSDVALKLVTPEGSSNPAKALEEARLLARVRHPNVVTVYGADLVDGRVGVWMEFVKGRTLADLLRTRGPFSAREAALVGMDLCRALAAVHAEGHIHGDVKAHNVMREEGGRTVLMDFGTGKDLSKDPAGSGRDAMDDFAGTPLYLPPEVFQGQKRTKVTDIYSLGVLLYHLVTAAYPVHGRTRNEVEQAHRRNERRRLRDLRPDLPADFVQTVERAVAADANQRYQSAGAFEEALQGQRQDPQPSPMRRRMILVASAVAAAVVVGVVYNGIRDPVQRTTSPAAHTTPPPAIQEQTASSSAVSTGTYQIEPAFYRERDGQPEVRLRSGARVAPGDNIFVKVRASAPTYVYIVNEDERGTAYLEFPLPGQSVTNPLAPDKTHRLPGRVGSREYSWVVDTAGGREHFIVFASPQPLGDFEQSVFAALPRPEIGKPVMSTPLSDAAAGALRSVGGLVAKTDSRPQKIGALIQLFPKPLGDTEETAEGLWVRQLTLENPSR